MQNVRGSLGDRSRLVLALGWVWRARKARRLSLHGKQTNDKLLAVSMLGIRDWRGPVACRGVVRKSVARKVPAHEVLTKPLRDAVRANHYFDVVKLRTTSQHGISNIRVWW